MDQSLAIDIDKLVSTHSSKPLPKAVTRTLAKAIHLDEINDFLVRGYQGVEFCEQAIKRLDVTIEVKGKEHLDTLSDESRYTFVGNHPLGGIDGISMGAIIGRRFNGKIKYFANSILMAVKGMASLCVPINKLGGQARNLPALIDEAFASDNQIIMFPAGLCSRLIDGKIQDIAWTKTFITYSVASHRDVVPFRFVGRNSKRFYLLAKACKALHIKFNFAMLTLPDEMVKGIGNHYTVIFGEPIPWQTFDSSKTPLQWAAWVRERVYSLKVQ